LPAARSVTVICALGILFGTLPAPGAGPVILPAGATVEKVAGGCKFTEGPAVDAAGNVFFSDSPNNRIMVLPAGGTARVWKTGTRGANGMLFDRQGRLVTCNSQLAPDGRSVTRYEKNGRVTLLADRYAGKKLNSPNDLALDRSGRIYFTDPRYGEAGDLEQDRMAVYRIEKDGKLTPVIDDVQVPNGILITPDNRTLYVADNNPAQGGARTLIAYDIDRGRRVSRRKVLYDLGSERGIDGMVLDVEGNIYATAGLGERTGVYVISPQGNLLTFIRTPETATNCTFGGPDLRTLYITAGESLYRIRTTLSGWLVYPSLKQAANPPQGASLVEGKRPGSLRP
jgi:gluconolactonase